MPFRKSQTTIYIGDCRDVLKSLPDESVHCVITSPPYWGLRDYGTAEWEGGNPKCDHIGGLNRPRSKRPLGKFHGGDDNFHATPFKDICGKCGARRIDNQIGLESDYKTYVDEMVDVFREVWRVLRDDGSCWINLGSSYASGGMNPNQSPFLQRVPAYDNDDKAPSNLKVSDFSCHDPYDEYQGDYRNRHGRISHSARQRRETSLHPLQTNHDNEPEDSEKVPLYVSFRDVQASTKLESFSRPPGASYSTTKASVSQKAHSTYENDAPSSEHMSDCISDIVSMRPPLVVRTSGKESFFSACKRPDCKGIGKCGLCWSALATPSLNVKAKDELNTPHFVALALQADGWILRQTICWSKSNSMPESVTDRCTKSHEYIFLLTKSPKYFFDADAIRENAVSDHGAGNSFTSYQKRIIDNSPLTGGTAPQKPWDDVGGKRNKRSVWTIPTAAYHDSHFATFPPDLIQPCILAGTSANGCCEKCGAPWVREVERENIPPTQTPRQKHLTSAQNRGGPNWTGKNKGSSTTFGLTAAQMPSRKTTGFSPSCNCNAPQIPCTILDPFAGTGTVAMVANKCGRDAVLIELNPKSVEMARKRLGGGSLVSKPPKIIDFGKL